MSNLNKAIFQSFLIGHDDETFADFTSFSGGKYGAGQVIPDRFLSIIAGLDWTRATSDLNDQAAYRNPATPDAAIIFTVDLDIKYKLINGATEFSVSDVMTLVEFTRRCVAEYADPGQIWVFGRSPNALSGGFKIGLHIYFPELFVTRFGSRQIKLIVNEALQSGFPNLTSVAVTNPGDVFDLDIGSLRCVASVKRNAGAESLYRPIIALDSDGGRDCGQLRYLQNVCAGSDVGAKVELLKRISLFIIREESPTNPEFKAREAPTEFKFDDEGTGKAVKILESYPRDEKGFITAENRLRMKQHAACLAFVEQAIPIGKRNHRASDVEILRKKDRFIVTFCSGHGYCFHRAFKQIQKKKLGRTPMQSAENAFREKMQAIFKGDYEIQPHSSNRTRLVIQKNFYRFQCIDKNCCSTAYDTLACFQSQVLLKQLFGSPNHLSLRGSKTPQTNDLETRDTFKTRLELMAKRIVVQDNRERSLWNVPTGFALQPCECTGEEIVGPEHPKGYHDAWLTCQFVLPK